MKAACTIEKKHVSLHGENLNKSQQATMNLHSTILRNAETHPEKTSLIYFRKRITYGELAKHTNHYASILYDMGLRPNDVATVSLPTTPESIAITYALNMIGATVCNVDVRSTADQISEIVKRTKSRVLFTMDFNIKKISRKSLEPCVEHIFVLKGNESFPKAVFWSKTWDFLCGRHRHMRFDKRFGYWYDIAKRDGAGEVPVHEWPADSPQLIFQTSGTTGKSKSAMISAENMNNPLAVANELYNDWEGNDTFLCILPIFTMSGFQSSVHSPLYFGNTIDIVPIWKSSDFIRILQRHRPQHIFSVPSFWEPLFDESNAKADFSFLKTAVLAGDIMKSETEKKINTFLSEHNCPYGLKKVYGMTETAGIVAVTPNEDGHKYTSGFSGKVTAGHKVRIIDGEICVLTATKALGYYADPEATSALLRQHGECLWLHTGDMGHFDENGNLYVDGRIKRMIVRYDGTKIFPVEIETAMMKHPQVKDCVVVGTPDRNHPQSLLPMAFVTTTDDEVGEHDLMKFAQKTLPVHLQPSKIQVIKKIPVTKNGKTDYEELAKSSD